MNKHILNRLDKLEREYIRVSAQVSTIDNSVDKMVIIQLNKMIEDLRNKVEILTKEKEDLIKENNNLKEKYNHCLCDSYELSTQLEKLKN